VTGPTPGVTDTEIVLGANVPLTGPATALLLTNAGAKAYFDDVNDQGGINGRKIRYVYKDDGYDPGKTVQAVRELVESDKIFAMFNGIGTATSLAALPYLAQQGVPDMYVGSGSVAFSDVQKYPNVFGWQINNTSEGKIIGAYIAKTYPGKKVGLLFQNDDFGQHMEQGFETGIGSANPVVSKQPYEASATSLSTQAAALKNAGAEIVPLAASLNFVVQFVKAADAMDYHPQFAFNWSSGDPNLFKLVGDPKLVEGAITDEFMPLYTDTSNPKVASYKAVWDKRGDGKPFGVLVMYGMAEAQTMVKTLQLAGKDLTRPGLIKAAESLQNYTDTVVSVPFGFSATDHSGITSAQMVQIKNGDFQYFPSIFSATIPGPVTVKS